MEETYIEKRMRQLLEKLERVEGGGHRFARLTLEEVSIVLELLDPNRRKNDNTTNEVY